VIRYDSFMTKKQRNVYRAVLLTVATVALLGIDLDVDVTLNPLFGLFG
jgi:hypothetical protein